MPRLLILQGAKNLFGLIIKLRSNSYSADNYNIIKGELIRMKDKFLRGRCLIRIITFVLAAFAVLGGFIAIKCRENKMLRINIENTYQHSLDELCAGIENIEISLEKAIYASSPSFLSSLSADILKDATAAKAHLSALPSNGQALEQINKFLSQAGDYSASLAEKAVSGGSIESTEKDNLISLQKSAADLSAALRNIAAEYEEGGKWSKETVGIINTIDFQSVFGDAVYHLEDTFTSYPSLLYDGPFSDHILKASPVLLEGKAEITKEQAMKIAAEFLEIDQDSIAYDGSEDGRIRCYRFSGKDFTISVTAKGGYVAYYRKFREIPTSKINYNEAVEKAISFVGRFSDNSFTESYYFTDEGMCTVNLAYTQGNTICYTDLIKVGVAMDTGEVIMFESTGYIMNHTPRTIPLPTHSEAQARAILSDKLNVISVDEVLIPSPGTLEEFHCYEFYCTGIGDREYLVYIDANNLAERDIQIVLRADGGTMTK